MSGRYVLLLVSAAALAGCGGSGGGDPAPVSTPDPAPLPVREGPPVARLWNELALESIRNDYARPTVHARNLFHISAAMYDAWAVYSNSASTYLLGKQLDGFACDLNPLARPGDVTAAREEAISHAVYRLILHRFEESPGADFIAAAAGDLMSRLGFDTDDTSLAYTTGSAAALGNYLADCYIRFGFQDGSNEQNDYANTSYTPVNPAIAPAEPGNPDIVDLDRWQPISLTVFIDQAGNEIDDNEPDFLGPEWGSVRAFALEAVARSVYERDGFEYWVYHDPGPPPSHRGTTSEHYKRGFSLVSVWSSHLDPDDGVMIDISPASIGNIAQYPSTVEQYDQFYDYFNGGDPGRGYATNPVTGAPYERQEVPRGDYTRVLAEFWADGPDSETPPGHWFVILNEVSDHPQLDRRFAGAGAELDSLEWYVKAYFALGGAMHDSAIAAWGVKGWYDYIRPLSAIRGMAEYGQSTDPGGSSYSQDGLPLVPGYIEVVQPGDPIADGVTTNAGKIKLKAWRGPRFIEDLTTEHAGVDWILAEHWVPYQRPSFVTPPFAGYVSGHSTYSRAAAEVLTAFTGSEYFPGGMSEFEIAANDFLVFENGPSMDMTLQWATYRDAADQCSLSRIWGGIHPPADDIPGRRIGEQVGQDAFDLARAYFQGLI
ncbi:MAG: vanadium-dependent haloperoxidase [Rhodospirillaceae bacterium]|nr:vanadium-dependent haloperoxidase [Rhodospirillaceae bacterium]